MQNQQRFNFNSFNSDLSEFDKIPVKLNIIPFTPPLYHIDFKPISSTVKKKSQNFTKSPPYFVSALNDRYFI